ncbi:hypothetical protein K1719_043310 [Acacia pycnantha]|nr:hypothetical protein K1719_043310 [Acacia pycnantha]
MILDILTKIEEDRQFVHLSCDVIGMSKFILTGVYAIPHSDLRSRLWEKLLSISYGISLPWIVCGDLNDILVQSERVGGGNCNFRRVRWFQDKVNSCGLNVWGASGPKFTWKGPCLRGCRRLFERLDRALANQAFLATMHDCVVKVRARRPFRPQPTTDFIRREAEWSL